MDGYAQKIDYRYNIRGWLERINTADLTEEDENQRKDLFGMEIGYTDNLGYDANSQYNGNIAAIKWGNHINDVSASESAGMQAYGYKYDNVNRIEEANYHENASSASSTKYQLRIHEYDKNGNIKRLDRRNANSDLMDQLTYVYSGHGNQLQSVKDDGIVTEGFMDGNTGAVDYTYDDNGNMISDANKNISSIDYNMLNLPELITFNDGKQIKYIYDASGIKLRKEAYENEQLVKTTNYIGAVIEENDELKFVQTSEGRIVPKVVNNQFINEYQYHLKDHLGNVRTTFAVKDDQFTTSFETNNEIDFIGSYENIIRENKSFSRTGDYVHKLTGGTEENVVGLMKTLKVTKGDKVSAEVYGTYLAGEEAGGNLNLGTIVGAVVNALSGGGSGLEGMNDQDLINNGFNAAAIGDDDNSSHPNAYLNFVLLDENYQYVSEASGFQRLDANATTDGSNTAEFDHLYFEDITIPEDGYLMVYVSNESQNVTEVYWDDFTIRHQYNDVVQKDDYYPFGLTFNSFSKSVLISQRFKNQGKEEQIEIGLGTYDFEARFYDATLARTMQIDPLADRFVDQSTYVWVLNNPLSTIDPDGRESVSFVGSEAQNFFRLLVQYHDTPFDNNLNSETDPNQSENNNNAGQDENVLNDQMNLDYDDISNEKKLEIGLYKNIDNNNFRDPDKPPYKDSRFTGKTRNINGTVYYILSDNVTGKKFMVDKNWNSYDSGSIFSYFPGGSKFKYTRMGKSKTGYYIMDGGPLRVIDQIFGLFIPMPKGVLPGQPYIIGPGLPYIPNEGPEG